MKSALFFLLFVALSFASLGDLTFASNLLNKAEDVLESIPKPEWVTNSEDMVTTQYGTLQGIVYKTARAFYAIPYASPPVGNLRWQDPEDALPWNGTRNAQQYGPGCPQDCALPLYTCPFGGYSEDCLTVDVFTPRNATSGDNYPVLFFIHGGNFIQGGTGTFIYNGDFLANNTNVVVVNVQYRLGALGWFYNGEEGSGNYGIKDQTKALEWVRDNIADFGGNPQHVTIWGQSAGASSVLCHNISPSSYGLFGGSIMDSNPATLEYNTPSQAQGISNRMAVDLGCASELDTACLMAADPQDIVTAQTSAASYIDIQHPLNAFMPWLPMVDGTYIPMQPMDAVVSGNFAKVPFVTGTVNNEGNLFIYGAFPDPLPVAEYRAVLKVVFRRDSRKVWERYPCEGADVADCRDVMSILGTDYIFACPTRHILRSMNNQSISTYLYHFDHPFTNFQPWGNDTECIGKSCHGTELPYAFNSAEIGNHFTGYTWSAGEAVLATQTSTFWGNFATSRNPNTPKDNGGLVWPAYTLETGSSSYYNNPFDQDMHLSVPSAAESNYLEDACDFFDSIGYTDGV